MEETRHWISLFRWINYKQGNCFSSSNSDIKGVENYSMFSSGSSTNFASSWFVQCMDENGPCSVGIRDFSVGE